MILYVDMLLIENTLVNYFILALTCKTLNHKYSVFKTIVAAFIGALSCFLVIFFSPDRLGTMLLKLITAMIMAMITYPLKIKNHVKEYIKILVTMFVYSMILGGMCIFLNYNDKGVMVSNSYTMSMPYKKLIFSMIIAYLMGDRIMSYIKRRMCMKHLLYKIKISVKGLEREINGFMDTGNELIEPVTNLPVVIVEKNIFRGIELDKNESFRIPYKVVSGDDGYLEGVKAEYILIENNGSFERKDAMVVFSNATLSNIGEYNAILSKELIL